MADILIVQRSTAAGVNYCTILLKQKQSCIECSTLRYCTEKLWQHSPPPDDLLTLIGPNDSGFTLVRSGSKLPAAGRCTMELPDTVTSRMRECADCQYGTMPSATALLTSVVDTQPHDAQFSKSSNNCRRVRRGVEKNTPPLIQPNIKRRVALFCPRVSVQ